MVTFIKRLFILAIFVAIAWFPGKGLFKDLGLFEGKPTESSTEIIELSAEQIYTLLKKGSARNAQTILFYSFNFKCQVCWTNLEDVNDIARDYYGEKLTVIALAQSTSEDYLKTILDGLEGGAVLHVFRLKAGDEIILGNRLKSLGMNYNKPPYLGIIYQDGIVTNLAVGARRSNKIRAEIDRYMRK